MDAATSLLVNADWLNKNLAASGVIFIDTRSPEHYWAGHLPGARHFDPFPFHYSDTSEARLKEVRAQLEWIFSALGITHEHTVVFYENDSGMRATRGLWLLEYLGHQRARILDGGLKAASGVALSKTAAPVSPSRFEARPRDAIIASYQYVLEALGRADRKVFDVRSDEEYYSERIRARHGGAIPGAIHRDWILNNDSEGTFKSPAELKRIFIALGLAPEQEIITYCQGGYRAAHTWLALRLAGFHNVRNYLGSWAEWGNHDDLPIEYPQRPR